MRLVRKHHMFVRSAAPDSIIGHQDKQEDHFGELDGQRETQALSGNTY